MTGAVVGPKLPGRASLIRAVAEELVAPESVGVVLVGEPGIGKTAIARQVAGHLRDTMNVLPVRGGSGLRSIPYGAMSRYLGGLTAADVESPAAILRYVMKHVTRGATAQGPPVIVVDDAHHLDDESALLIMQLATARRVKVLVTARLVPGPAGEFARAVKDGLLGQHVVEQLAFPAIRKVCELVLGGPVLTGTVRLLAEATRGNPLFLTMLLRQGMDQGRLVEENGVWRSRGPRLVPGAALADLVLHGLGERSADELAVVESLAVSGPVPLAALEADVDRSVLARLAQEQVLEIDPEQLVSLRLPLLAEAIRSSMPAARLLERTRNAPAARSEAPTGLRDVLGAVGSALETASPMDDALLLRAARIGNRLHDPSFAQRALGAVQASAPTAPYLLETAWVHWNERNDELARATLEEAFQAPDSGGIAGDGMVLSLLLRCREGAGADELEDDVERWAGLHSTGAGQGDGGPNGPAIAADRTDLFRAFAGIIRGDLRGVEELVALPTEPALPAVVQLGHLGLLAHALTRTGRPRAASELLEKARTLLDADPEPLLAYRDLAAGEQLLALVCRGSWDQARAVFHAAYPAGTAASFLLSGWLDLADGSMSLRTGSFRTARHQLLLAVEAFRDADESHLLDWICALAAYACARAGDAPGTRALVDARSERHRQSPSVTHRMADSYFSAALGHLGEPDAVARLRWTATEAEGRGSLLVAATALHHAVMLGDRTAFQDLADVTEAFDGEDGLLLHGFAAAAAAGDRDALVAAGDAARERGYLPLAVRCLEEAVSAGPAGAAARGIERKLSALRAELKVVPGGAVTPDAPGTRLTRGEQAIVTLVAAGHTNREIAGIQGISTRTVEGHLYRIFAKLGISSREALQEPPGTTSP